MYTWEHSDWPQFRWNTDKLSETLGQARLKQGMLLGKMQSLGLALEMSSHAETLVLDAMKTSEIEGEILDGDSVRSSVARRLGIKDYRRTPPNPRSDGVVAMLVDATANYNRPLTRARLLKWHKALFLPESSALHPVTSGKFRTEKSDPMQVISGVIDRERVHFEAPPGGRVESHITAFLAWFNNPPPIDALLFAAIAHLWFITIHPFEDGNGRVARAITDMVLAKSEASPFRFYSMSNQVRQERSDYYRVLEQAQKGSLDITPWIAWFLGCFNRAVDAADNISESVLMRAAFWQKYSHVNFSDRQRKNLTRLMDGFEGNITVKKWAALGKCSIATAQRDIDHLVETQILVRNTGGSKNTSYRFVKYAA